MPHKYYDGRFYKNQKEEGTIDFNSVVIPLDSGSWKSPRILTLKMLENHLHIVANDEIVVDRNITSIEISGQENAPNLSPDIKAIVERSYIAIDPNYLYVWIELQKKWKRIPLSEW